MDWLQFLAALVKSLAWPTTLVILVLADCCSYLYLYWEATWENLEAADSASRKAVLRIRLMDLTA